MKRMKRKAKLIRHRLIYWRDRNPEEFGFWFCMAGLVLCQVLLFLSQIIQQGGPTRLSAARPVWLGKMFHFGEMFHQQAMNKDIAAADTAEEDQINGILKEGEQMPRQ